MNNLVMSESSIHYIAGLLDHYANSNQTKHHIDAMKEIRTISNKLLETLEEPTRISVHRHQLKRD